MRLNTRKLAGPVLLGPRSAGQNVSGRPPRRSSKRWTDSEPYGRISGLKQIVTVSSVWDPYEALLVAASVRASLKNIFRDAESARDVHTRQHVSSETSIFV
jgi:hypothetical protein